MRTNYPSDLTDSQWEQIKEFFPQGPKYDYQPAFCGADQRGRDKDGADVREGQCGNLRGKKWPYVADKSVYDHEKRAGKDRVTE